MGQLANIILQQIEGMHLGYCPPRNKQHIAKNMDNQQGFPSNMIYKW